MAKSSAQRAAQPISRTPKKRQPERVKRKAARQPSPAQAVAQRDAESVLALQRSVGNRAVNDLLHPGRVQARLAVGPAHDSYETEAERVASQVVRHLASDTQRRPEAEPAAAVGAVQRAGGEAGFEAGPGVERALTAGRGGGQPIPPDVRGRLEQGFGADFSGVRVHADAQAAQVSRSLAAQAFTHGSDVYFAAGQYNPASSRGQHLLAHELTHVLQQAGDARRKPARLQRYALNAFKPGVKVDWIKETSVVTKSKEGVSGGVYFFNSPFHPVTKLVIKPEYVGGDSVPEQALEAEHHGARAKGQFADTFLAQVARVQTPDARIVEPQSPEGSAIRIAAGAKGPGIAPTLNAGIEGVKTLAFLKVMAAAGGQSVGSAAAKAETAWDVNTIVAQFDADDVLRKVGRLIVADAFIGNQDRINTARATNVGNLMYGSRNITAIDSEALFNKLASINLADLDRALRLINDLFAKKELFVERFMEGILYNLPPNTDAYKEFKRIKETDQLRWKPRLGHFIDEGIQSLIGRLTSGTKSMLKREMEAWEQAGSGVSDWNTFRVREKYLKLRAASLDHDRARQLVADYVLYRERRRGRFKGLKWTAKFL